MQYSWLKGCIYVAGITGMFFKVSIAQALDWTLQPSFEVEQIYSDNTKLTLKNRQNAWITQINPGISIKASSIRHAFDINYRLQSLFNMTANETQNDINHQLQANSAYELIHNKVFLDSSATINQQNISNRVISSDNIASDNTNTTVYTFQSAPYWKLHLNSFADMDIRVNYDFVDTKGGGGSIDNNALSQTHGVSETINLTSGRDFSRVSWGLSFNNSHRFNSDIIRFQNSTADLRYAIGRKFSIFTQLGHSLNDFQTTSDTNKNGLSYTFGGQWKPSQRFRLEVGYGNNYFVTVDITPFNRLNWVTTYSNNDIGLNRGDTWDTQFNYNTRRTLWNISYSEATVTTQQLLLEQKIFNVEDIFGDQNTDILLNQAQRNNIQLPSLTDEVFTTRTINASVAFRSGKSDITLDFYKTFRTYEVSGNNEEVLGLSGRWSWDFYNKMNAIMMLSGQRTEAKGVNAFVDDRIETSVTITRRILSRLNAKLEYRFTTQKSSDVEKNYFENRVSANLTFKF